MYISLESEAGGSLSGIIVAAVAETNGRLWVFFVAFFPL